MVLPFLWWGCWEVSHFQQRTISVSMSIFIEIHLEPFKLQTDRQTDMQMKKHNHFQQRTVRYNRVKVAGLMNLLVALASLIIYVAKFALVTAVAGWFCVTARDILMLGWKNQRASGRKRGNPTTSAEADIQRETDVCICGLLFSFNNIHYQCVSHPILV